MKWPSSSASAARNSARISSSVIMSEQRPLGRAATRFNRLRVEQALEALETRAYRDRPNPGPRVRRAPVPTHATGVKMKLIGWAIALAAAGLTPAAAQTPGQLSRRPLPAPQPPTAAGGNRRRTAAKPDAAQPRDRATARVGHTDPDAGHRRARRAQGHPGPGHADRPAKPRPSTTTGCCCCARSISVFVLVLLLYAMVRFRRGANPTPSRNSHNTADRGDLDAGPGADPGRRSRSPRSGCCAHQYSPPPADVTVKVTGHQWYWTYEYPDNGGSSSTANMLKEAERPDAGRRTSARAPTPTARRCSRSTSGMVIPAGKVVKFIVTADDVIHSFAVPAFWIKHGRQPRPAQRDLGQGRPAGRLFRPMLRAVRRAPRLHADRGRGRSAGAVRRLGRVEGRHMPGASPPPAPARGTAAARPRPPQPPPPAQQPATNQAATAQN